MSTATLTLTTAALEKLLRPVLPLAAADDYLPVLSALHLRSRGDQLVAAATDRYVIGAQRVSLERRPRAAVRASLPLEAARHLLATFRGAGRRGSRARVEYPLALAFREDHLEVSGPSAVAESLTARYPLYMASIPDLGSVFRRAGTPTTGLDAGQDLGINLQLLERFGPALRCNGVSHAYLQVNQGPTRVVALATGPDFRGAVMPGRPTAPDPEADEAALADAWAALWGALK